MRIPLRHFSILLLFSCCFFALNAQEVQVIDKDSREPLPGVTILNDNRSKGVVTDANGKASLTSFSENATLIFRHSSYLEKRVKKQALEKQAWVVALTENIVQIQEVVVSANRWEQKQEDIPNDILAITAKEIALQNPQTTADMLQQTGEVFVQKSQQGGGSPMLRGFAANSILLVVDGVRMNNAIYRSGNLQNVINLDANILEGAEVIFGPGSVIYGSDALGGVMDFHTKDPLLKVGENVHVEGSAMMRYATANGEKSAHADVSLGGDKIASLSSISWSSFGDLRAGTLGLSEYPDYFVRKEYVIQENGEDKVIQNPDSHLQVGSGYEQLNLLQKIRYAPSESVDYLYSFHYSTSSDIPRYDRLTQRSNDAGRSGPLRFAEWYYGPQNWMLHSLQANFSTHKQLFERIRIIGAYQRYEESRHSRRFGNKWRENQEENVDVLTLNADFEKLFDERKRLFYGLESAYNGVSSYAEQVNIRTGDKELIAPRYGDVGNKTLALAAYSSFQYPLSSTLMLNTGARYSWYTLESQFSDRFYPFPFDAIRLNTGALNGNLGIAYAKDGLRYDLLVSSGFRAPNVDDLTKLFDPAPGTVTVPNPNLQPEYSYNLESSIGYEGKQYLFMLTAYTSLLDNALVRRPFQFDGQDSILYQGERKRVVALVNTGSGLIAGGSANVRIQPAPKWLLASTLTYSWGEDRATGERLRHIPPLFGQTSVRYQRQKWSALLQIRYNGRIRWEDLPEEEQSKGNIYAPEGVKSWITADLKANVRPTPYLELSSGLENILDLHYRTYSSGISAPGRNLYISLRTYF